MEKGLVMMRGRPALEGLVGARRTYFFLTAFSQAVVTFDASSTIASSPDRASLMPVYL